MVYDLSSLIEEIVGESTLDKWIDSLVKEAHVYVSIIGRGGQKRNGVLLEGESLLDRVYERFIEEGFVAVWRAGLDDEFLISNNDLYEIDLDDYFASNLREEMELRIRYGY